MFLPSCKICIWGECEVVLTFKGYGGRLWNLSSSRWWLWCCGDCSTSGHISHICIAHLTQGVQFSVHWLSFWVSSCVINAGCPRSIQTHCIPNRRKKFKNQYHSWGIVQSVKIFAIMKLRLTFQKISLYGPDATTAKIQMVCSFYHSCWATSSTKA